MDVCEIKNAWGSLFREGDLASYEKDFWRNLAEVILMS